MIVRVSCETYDKAWYVNTSSKKRAIVLVREMTEGLGWNLEYPNEEREWEAEQVFTTKDEIVESSDL